MQMRMEKQVLSPTVKYGEKTDLGAQMLGIGSDGRQGLGSGSAEDAVDGSFVLGSNVSDLLWDREDDMKIMSRDNSAGSPFNPLATHHRLQFFASTIPPPL